MGRVHEGGCSVNTFERGDRVVVVTDAECPEYVGKYGTVVEVRDGVVCRVGEPEPRPTVIVSLDNRADGGYPDGFDVEQLAPESLRVAA